jgi:hypothetical protein
MLIAAAPEGRLFLLLSVSTGAIARLVAKVESRPLRPVRLRAPERSPQTIPLP